MEKLLDFLTAALPYVAIGFWVAYMVVKGNAKKPGQEMKMKWGVFFPPAAMLVVAILDFADKDRSGGTTWLILAVVFLVLGLQQDEEKDG